MRRKRLRYGEFALIGFIAGALLFLPYHVAVDSSLSALPLALFTAGGVLIACTLVFFWNRAWRKAHQRHDQRRGISLTPPGDGE